MPKAGSARTSGISRPQRRQELFAFGQQLAAERGLILVDTKYEFGVTDDGEIILIDEIHTPDSSRYWLADTYATRLAAGQEPDMIDKEFFRLWFRERCDPYKDAVLPTPPDDLIAELAARYIQAFEAITGSEFTPDLRSLEATVMAGLVAMKESILIIGSGAREHAVAVALARSPQQPDTFLLRLRTQSRHPGIFAAPTRPAASPDIAAILAFAPQSHPPTFAIIGPEAPLAAGVADALWAARHSRRRPDEKTRSNRIQQRLHTRASSQNTTSRATPFFSASHPSTVSKKVLARFPN